MKTCWCARCDSKFLCEYDSELCVDCEDDNKMSDWMHKEVKQTEREVLEQQ